MSKRKTRAHRGRLNVENLESRSLMAAFLAGGYLNIVGTAASDTAIVTDTNPVAPNSPVVVTLNGVASVFNEAAIAGVKFWGHGGHDSFSSGLARPVIAYGGDGNDTLHGGLTGRPALRPGRGRRHRRARRERLDLRRDAQRLAGRRDRQRLHDRPQGNDSILGGDGNDKLYGYIGNDTIRGGDGNDTLSGWDGADDLFGDAGNDKLYGHTGNDDLDGGTGNDQMYGSTGNDLLIGGDGNDTLSGSDGNDLLYGREGNDKLYGHDGRDGLMGGNGIDVVNGGNHSDRYLTIGDHAEISSMAGGDATIQFGGPQLWSYGEIEQIDLGLARMHHRTGNTILLKDPVGPVPADPKAPRVFIERDDVSADGYAAETHGNVITVYDESYDGSVEATEAVIIHEFAHMWDSPDENPYNLSGEDVPGYFRTLSGWRDDLGDAATGTEMSFGGQTYVKASQGTWWYDEDALFVTNYARTGPGEDFCETMSAVIMGSDYPFGSDPTAPVAKRAWINAWLE